MKSSKGAATVQRDTNGVPKPPASSTLRIVQILTIVLIVAAFGATVYFREHIQQIERLGYAAVFLVGLVANATIILPLPGLAVTSAMGAVCNPWIVGIVGGVGQALGELTGYMAGYSGQTWVDENPTYRRLTRWMQRHGVWPIFVLASIPNPLFDIAGLAAGALRFPWWKFLLSCLAGEIVKNTLFALAGSYSIDALYRLFAG